MSTYSHPLRPIHINRITLASPDPTVSLETEQEELVAPPDDGLGCMRGLAVVMLSYVIFALVIGAGWGLWRLLR